MVGLFVGSVAGFGLGLFLGGGGLSALSGEDARGPPPAPVVLPVPGAILGRGPHEGYVLALDSARLRLEVVHNEHWGIVGIYLFDADMKPRDPESAPVLNILFDDESIVLEPSRENWDGDEDGGWHYEHDALLGLPETARFRIKVDGRIYGPIFRHVHLNDEHEGGHGHAAEEDA